MTASPEAFAAALAGLGMGPARLAALLREHDPAEAFAIAGGRGGEAAVEAAWTATVEAGVSVYLRGTDGYPCRLADDHQAPAVLFSRGWLGALDWPLVSIVGTRRCSHTGREVAAQLGRELALAGVGVVSGLALGIDGAAHEGALEADAAPAVGVVGSGLDVVYPKRHASLWERVAAKGLLLSEAPLGAAPEAWRFPARNRVLAALADVVVVVESHVAGGSMHTVRAAEERGRVIMAVPGSVRNPASAGCNKLLSEGLPPARDTDDVLAALALATAGRPDWPATAVEFAAAHPTPGATPTAAAPRPVPAGIDALVLDAVGWEPTSVEAVLRRTDLGVGQAAAALSRLQRKGWVRGQAGWWERIVVGP